MRDICLLSDGVAPTFGDNAMFCSFAVFNGTTPDMDQFLYHMDRAILVWAVKQFRAGIFTAEAAALFCGLTWLKTQGLLDRDTHVHIFSDNASLVDFANDPSKENECIMKNRMEVLPELLAMPGKVTAKHIPGYRMKMTIIGH